MNNDGDSRGVLRRRVVVAIVAAALATAALLTIAIAYSSFPGMDIFFYIVMGFSILIVSYLALHALRAGKKLSKPAKVLQRCLVICAAVGLAVFVLLQGLIISAARTEDGEVDCLIILGAGLYGEIPSRTLVSRLEAAVRYAGERDDLLIVVSGGQGSGETITEAEAMSRYLVRCGIEESRILKEGRSTSTWENLAFSKALLEEHGLDTGGMSVAVVTNEFHLYRAKYVAGSLGLNAIGIAAQTPYPSLRILYHCREALALLNSFLFGWNA